MLLYNGLYSWDGWGGALKLGSGRCRLRIFDIRQSASRKVSPLRPYIVIASDIPFEKQAPNQMSVKSCASHIATLLSGEYGINPHRMFFIDYMEGSSGSAGSKYVLKDQFDEAWFKWKDGKAIGTRWTPLKRDMENLVRHLLNEINE